MKKKKLILLVILIVCSALAIFYYEQLFNLILRLEVEGSRMPFVSALVLIFLKTISAPLGVPGTPLTLLSGAIFNNFWGTLVALIGNTAGAVLAFLLSRYILRDYVQNKFLSKYPKIKEYETRLEKRGLITVAVLRLIPLFPFNVLNFVLGVTKIKFKDYLIGSFVGMIPGAFVFVSLGGSLSALDPMNITLSILGIFALIYLGKWYERKYERKSGE